jgi:CRISPR-associated protein Csb1
MISQFDTWFKEDGPVAVVIQEHLQPVGGEGAVFFPPTFAPPVEERDRKPDYVIDEKTGICLVDSVGSQGNRLEPVFLRDEFAPLVPRVTVTAGQRIINILEAGHRAADAVVRFSDLWPLLQEAFLAYRDHGNAAKLAKIAPTSLVFGAWDSRDTGAKIPRLVESTVRAYGVSRLSRAAQFVASVEREDLVENYSNDFLSGVGLVDNPSGSSPGGVVAKDGIRRDATLNLVAVRALAGVSDSETQNLRRYVLGLALVAFLAPADLYLRQGCLLVGMPDKSNKVETVDRKGVRTPFDLDHSGIREFAYAAAKEFGVGEARKGIFDPAVLKKAFQEKEKKKKGK